MSAVTNKNRIIRIGVLGLESIGEVECLTCACRWEVGPYKVSFESRKSFDAAKQKALAEECPKCNPQ